ncbi:MAG TPA: PAS domain S-box protein [Opitutaceae bacterium]
MPSSATFAGPAIDTSDALLRLEWLVLNLLADGMPLDAVLHELVLAIEEASGNPDLIGEVLLLDCEGVHLLHGAAPRLPESFNRAFHGTAIGPAVGSSGTAAWRREAVVVEDIASDPLWAPYKDLALPHGLHACWSVPLLDNEHRVRGTFSLYRHEPGRPGEAEMHFVEAASNVARLAIQHGQAQAHLHLLHNAVARVNDLVMITEADPVEEPGPRIVFVNEACERITGYTPAEAIGRSPRFLASPHASRDALARLHAAFAEQHAERVELLNRTKEGRDYWVEISVTPITGPEGCVTHFAAIERDITAVREQERLFRAIFEHTFELIGVLRTDGTLVAANRAALELIGAQPEDVVEQAFWDTPWWSHSAELQAQLRAAVIRAAQGSVSRFEATHRDTSGQLRFIDFSLRAVLDEQHRVGFLIFEGRDVTERRQAEEALRLAQERCDLAVGGSSIGLWDWNILTDEIFFAARFIEALGYAPSEFPARHQALIDALHPDDRPRVEAALTAHLRQHKAYDLEYRLRSKSGAYRWIAARGQALWDAGGHAYRMAGSVIDITDHKQLEEQLVQAQRLEGIGTLAGGIAHDLNNILAPIAMATDLLRPFVTDARAAQLVDAISASTNRAADLVRQILVFARGGSGQRTTVQPAVLIRALNRMLADTLPKSIRFSTHVASDAGVIHGQATQLEQVLLNLCVNARDAMPQGGELRVNASNQVVDTAFAGQHLNARPGDYVRFDVEDTGSGIAPEILHRIFDPFFTTKEVGRGTGLGLATTRSIVHRHGGFIALETAVGRGTRFSLFLPSVGAPPPPPAPSRPPAATGALPRFSGEHVLIVDDEPAMLDIAKRLLEGLGLRVTVAAGGAEAITAFKASPTPPDVTLLDLHMPGMDGVTTARALHALAPTLPMIGMSGYVQPHTLAELRATGAAFFIEKPFSPETLQQTLRDALATRKAEA